MQTMQRLYVDFNTLTSAPVDILKLGGVERDDLPPLCDGEQVIAYDSEFEVQARVIFDPEHAFWLAEPDWTTRRNFATQEQDTNK